MWIATMGVPQVGSSMGPQKDVPQCGSVSWIHQGFAVLRRPSCVLHHVISLRVFPSWFLLSGSTRGIMGGPPNVVLSGGPPMCYSLWGNPFREPLEDPF